MEGPYGQYGMWTTSPLHLAPSDGAGPADRRAFFCVARTVFERRHILPSEAPTSSSLPDSGSFTAASLNRGRSSDLSRQLATTVLLGRSKIRPRFQLASLRCPETDKLLR